MGATTYGWQTLFLGFKTWSARTLYVYAHADLGQKYFFFCLQVVLPGRQFSFPSLGIFTGGANKETPTGKK
jgi:hypothetical protein